MYVPNITPSLGAGLNGSTTMEYRCNKCGEVYHDEWLLIAHDLLDHDCIYSRQSVIQYAPQASDIDKQLEDDRNKCNQEEEIGKNVEEKSEGRKSVIQYVPSQSRRHQLVVEEEEGEEGRNEDTQEERIEISQEDSNEEEIDNEIIAEALEGRIVRHYRILNRKRLQLNQFLKSMMKVTVEILQEELRRLNFVKFLSSFGHYVFQRAKRSNT